MKRASEQGRATREKLLATTEAILAERGWEATTAQAIQQRAGISQGSWSHAFPDAKVQSAAEIYDRIHRDVWPDVLAPFENAGRKDAAAVIGRSLAGLFAYGVKTPLRLRLLPSLEYVLVEAARAGLVRAKQLEIERVLTGWAAKVLDAPSGNGDDLGRFLRPVVFGAALAILHDRPVSSLLAPPDGLIDTLTVAAWAGVRQLGGQQSPARSPKAERPPSAKGTNQPTLL